MLRLRVLSAWVCAAIGGSLVSGQTCDTTSGCSPLSQVSIELADGIWICGNAEITGSWESIWMMCNECNNYALPTISSLSLRMQPDVPSSWVTPSSWTSATTEARRETFEFVMTGQPAGGYAGGGWNSVVNADAGQPSSLSLAQIHMSRSAYHDTWVALTDGDEDTDMARGDSSFDHHHSPSAEFDTDGQRWMAMCLDASPYEGAYIWHHLWRKTVCTSGLTIEQSDVQCEGNLGDVCEYTCHADYHVYGSREIEGSVEDHLHQCVYDDSGTYGQFTGGLCVPDVCDTSYIRHSPSVCNGVPLQECDFECDPGYSRTGQHICNLQGVFEGGVCEPIQCTQGLTIENSDTICAGYTGDECEYECLDGYIPGAAHVCRPGGRFYGGFCTAPLSCDGIEWGPKRNDTCGVCGGDNSTCAGCNGEAYNPVRWDSCGICGGNYVPSVAIDMGDGSGTVGVRSSQALSIPTTAFWNSSCPSTSALSFEWSTDATVANGKLLQPLDERSSRSPTLRIPAGTLVAGEEIEITVRVTSSVVQRAVEGSAVRHGLRSVSTLESPEPPISVCFDNPIYCPRELVQITDTAETSIRINCVREPVQAVIAGGNRIVPRTGNVVLDASGSLDPQLSPEPFSYMWNCTKTGTAESCPGMGWRWEPTIHPPNDPVLSVPTEDLEASTAYDFSVTVTKVTQDGMVRNDTATVTITVAAGMVPSVNINQRDIRPKYNANERLVISGLVQSNLIPGIPPNEPGGETITLLWRGFGANSTGHFIPLDITAEGFLSTPVAARNLVVTAFQLDPGEQYRFRLTGTGMDGDAAAEVEINMNLSPVNGICRARCRTGECTSMREGMAIRDRFTLSALDWEDEDEGPLWYRFGYNDRSGQQFFVNDFTMTESVEAVIPAGGDDTEPTPFSVIVNCDIRDMYGGTAAGTDRITVVPYEVQGSLANAADETLSEASSSGDTQLRFQLVDAFATTLNDDGGRRRRYRRRMTEEEVAADATGARDILVDTLADMTSGGAVVGAAGRVATSLNAVSSNPDELSSDATDKSLSTVTNIADSGDKLDDDAVSGFASAAANLLLSSKGKFDEARRRRRLSEGNETAGPSAEEVAAAAERGNAIRDIVNAVAVGSTSEKVAGEAATVIETAAFGLETIREEPSAMEGKELAGGVQVPTGFLPDGFGGAVDSQVTSWKGDDHPFFYAASNNESNLTLASEVQSVSFNSEDGAEVPIYGLSNPFIVNISVPGGMLCPINSSKEFLGEDACVEDQYNCSYFDDETGAFVADGEVLNRTNYTLTCAFYHLTDLGGVAGPAPSTNKMDFDRMMSADFLMNNPVGFAISVALLMLLIFAFWWSIKEYIKETNDEGVTVNNASMMQTEFALSQCNYKVDKVSFKQRVIVKIRMDWDWGGLFFPMPGDPNSRAQRALVLLAATLFTLLFEIVFFKDPTGVIKFTEGEGKQEEVFQYDCLAGSKDPSLTAQEAYEICDDEEKGRLSEVCDPICEQFQPNGHLAALLVALISIPFSKSMGYAFGWLQEPYSAVIEGDDAAPPGRLQRWWNRCLRGKELKKEIAAMEKHPEDRSDAEIELLCKLMSQCELFEGLASQRDRREVARILTYKYKRQHSIIWEQGDMGKEVHSILRGNVTVMIKGPDGQSRPAGIINEGSYYGEKSFDNDNLRTAGIQTTDSPAELLVVIGDKLDTDVLDRLVDSITGRDDGNIISPGALAAERWREASRKLGAGQALGKLAAEASVKRTAAEQGSRLSRSFRRAKPKASGIAQLLEENTDSEEESERSTPPLQKRKQALLNGGDVTVLAADKEAATRPDDFEHDALQIRPEDLLMSASLFRQKLTPARKTPSPTRTAWHDDPEEVRRGESVPTKPLPVTPARQHWHNVQDEVLGVEDVAESPVGNEELDAVPKPPAGAPGTGRRKRRPANPWKDIISDVRNARATGAIDTTGDSTRGSALGVTVINTLAARQAGTGKELNPESGGDGKDETVTPHRKLTVVGAVNLRNADRFIGKSDPYAVVHWNGCRVGQTKIVKDSLDPRWKADFVLDDVPEERHQEFSELQISVWDHDFDRDDFLGQCTYMVRNGPKLDDTEQAGGVEVERELFRAKELPLKNHELKRKTKKSKQATGYVIVDLREGQDERTRVVRRRRTPLHDAACRGEHKKLVYLIDEAGWIESIDDKDPERGWSALHYAVFKGYKNCVRVLLQFTCNVNIADDFGWTPLMEAAWSGRCKSVLWMLGAGADPDAQDKDGWTALHAAAHQGNFGCSTALIDHGADRIVPDNSGQNAAVVAESRKYIALGHLIMFGTQDARRRKPVHAIIIFSYALIMGLACVLVVAATTAAFTMERTVSWLTATMLSLFLAMFIIDPIKIVLFGPVVHHLQAILKHKRAVGFLGVIVGCVAVAHDVKETFCPTTL